MSAEPLLPAQHLDDPGLPELPFGSGEVPVHQIQGEHPDDGAPGTSSPSPEDSAETKALYLELHWMKAIYFLGCLGGSCWGRFAQVSVARLVGEQN